MLNKLIGALLALSFAACQWQQYAGPRDQPCVSKDALIYQNNVLLPSLVKAHGKLTIGVINKGVDVNRLQQVKAAIPYAITEWVNVMRQASVEPLIDLQDVEIVEGRQQITVLLSPNTGRAYTLGNGDITFYVNSGPRVLVHEIGHLLGLQDTYQEATQACLPGYSGVMCDLGDISPQEVESARDALCYSLGDSCDINWQDRCF